MDSDGKTVEELAGRLVVLMLDLGERQCRLACGEWHYTVDFRDGRIRIRRRPGNPRSEETTMTQPQFRASHRIKLPSGEIEEVMLIDGAAYTRAEWENTTAADYERDESGAWTFQGEAFSGTVSEVA